MLTFGSLFAGIGGFDLGLERAGMRCLWQCEIDPYAERVLEEHWPDVLRVPDIRELGAGTVPPVDLVCGGFPCQDISLAGAGAGIDGERSSLWAEMFRVVRELRPRYVVVENVAALLGRGLDRVLRDLASCGLDAEWDCIPASAVGAPHRRDRIWLVAYPTRDLQAWPTPAGSERERARASCQPSGVLADSHSERGHGAGTLHEGRQEPANRGCGQRDMAHADRRGQRESDVGSQQSRRTQTVGPSEGLAGFDWWSVEPDVGRVAHGVPARVDRLRSLGNALVPQIAEWIGRRIIDYERGELSDAAA